MTAKAKKQSANNSAHMQNKCGTCGRFGALVIMFTAALSLSLIISISNSVKLFGETSKDVLTLYARVERLEFCVAKNISPCSYEKLQEWNDAHDSSEKFRPRIDDGFIR